MWDNILGLALNHGLWAALFVGLMVYVLRDGSKREKKYQETIKGLVQSLQVVEEIQTTTRELKEDVQVIKKKVRLEEKK